MSASVLYMSMSLDGFIAGPNEGPGNGLGEGAHRLHEWLMTGGDDQKGYVLTGPDVRAAGRWQLDRDP